MHIRAELPERGRDALCGIQTVGIAFISRAALDRLHVSNRERVAPAHGSANEAAATRVRVFGIAVPGPISKGQVVRVIIVFDVREEAVAIPPVGGRNKK